jgi:hypothetical protein
MSMRPVVFNDHAASRDQGTSTLKTLLRAGPAECASASLVELRGDVVETRSRDPGKIDSLGEVLAEKTVCVFIRPIPKKREEAVEVHHGYLQPTGAASVSIRSAVSDGEGDRFPHRATGGGTQKNASDREVEQPGECERCQSMLRNRAPWRARRRLGQLETIFTFRNWTNRFG